MKKITFLFLLITCVSFSQVRQTDYNLFQAKEFSKEIALFRAKSFLFNQVLTSSNNDLQFEVIPLAAASSGELTTLLYRSESQNKEGLILGFFGEYWNKAGVHFQGYAFKHMERETAIAFLNRIESALNKNKEFINDNVDSNNVVFQFDDMQILIYNNGTNYTFRIFWNDFDSTWENPAYNRTKRRFERKIK